MVLWYEAERGKLLVASLPKTKTAANVENQYIDAALPLFFFTVTSISVMRTSQPGKFLSKQTLLLVNLLPIPMKPIKTTSFNYLWGYCVWNQNFHHYK